MTSFNTHKIGQVFLGSATEVEKMFVGSNKVFDSTPPLATPTVTRSGSTLSITETDSRTEAFVVYDGSTVIATIYKINPTLNNITAAPSNPSSITQGGTVTLTFTADGTNWKVPTTAPTVTEATGVYNRISETECTITLSNPTGAVSFSVVGEKVDLTELCFTANTAGSTVELYCVGSPSIANTAYSLDRQNWISFTPSNKRGTNKITLTNVGDTVYFRNDITADFSANDYLKFSISGSVSASGNVNSIYVSTGFNGLDTLTFTYCYRYLFHGCSSLTTAPELPANTLSEYCYANMFTQCTSLTTTPKLQATNLSSYCYQNMFSNCTSLTTVSELPATTLSVCCYYGMFGACTSLSTVMELPATTLVLACYNYMFNGCTSLQVSDAQTTEADCEWDIPKTGTFTNDTIRDQSNVFVSCLGTRSRNDILGRYGRRCTYYTQNPPV